MSEEECKTNIIYWLSRKTTTNADILNEIIRQNSWDKEKFASVIGEQSKALGLSKEHLIVKSNAYTLSLIKDEPFVNNYVYLLRPFFSLFNEKIKWDLFYEINSKIKEDALECLLNRMVNLSLKVFIYDMSKLKEETSLLGEKPEERFESYLHIAGESEYLKNLYLKYPVLLRKLNNCVENFANFLNDVFSHLNEHWEEIHETFFDSSKNLKLLGLTFENGDTHEQGKTVILLRFNQGKVLYKPRNLYIEKNFKDVTNFFNQSDETLDIIQPKSLFFEEYCFTEFIEQKECTSLKEVEDYYTRYGQLIGLIYLTNGSDMHFENIISHGEYPVIIDYETLFSVQALYEGDSDSMFAKIMNLTRDSVSGSIMLPSEMKLDYEGNSVDISGLDGKTQKLAKKVFVPKRLNTDEASFELDNLVLESSNNLVYLNGELVDYQKYSDQIISGFLTVLNHFLKYKTDFMKLITNLKEEKIRVIVRNTNNYAQFLEFTKHPSCMKDFIEIEKVLENLYTFPHLDKKISKLEYEDMIFDDIPIFFTSLDSTILENSKGSEIYNAFSNTPRENLLNKLKSIDYGIVHKQVGIIKMQLLGEKGLSFTKTKELIETYPNFNYLDIAKKIGDRLIDSALIDKKNKMMVWATFNEIKNDKFEYSSSKIDYYNGILGVAKFLKLLGKETLDSSYNEYANYLINTAIMLVNPQNDDSAFVGANSLLNLLSYVNYDDFCYDSLQNFIVTLDDYSHFLNNESDSYDWLSGSSGLIDLYLNLFYQTNDQRYLAKAEFISAQIINSKGEMLFSNNLGIGHGISGLIISIARLYLCTKEANLKKYLEEIMEIQTKLLQNSSKENLFWCNGSLGGILSQAYVSSKLKLNFNNNHEDILIDIENTKYRTDCVCHGVSGVVQLLLDFSVIFQDAKYEQRATVLLDKMIHRWSKEEIIRIDTFEGFDNLSLYKGLSGIGYTLLRANNKRSVPSLLLND
ncbi:type 2 lantipeptide synthetase LanM [Enterococcus avium]|nr:type 2 lantipeptide synthetase LanM [Enterococcus avium]